MKKPKAITNQEWWAGLDAYGTDWRSELVKHAKATTSELTDKQLDKLLATTSLDLYLHAGGRIDLAPLRRFPNLRELRFKGFKELTGVDVLGELTGLRKLSLRADKLTDIRFLKRLVQLEDLDLAQNRITDISPLAGMKQLTVLDLGYNAIGDLSVLRGMSKLRELAIRANKVKDLTPLANLTALTELLASDNAYADLTPLATLVNLVELDVSGPFNKGKVTTLAPLGALKKLKRLDVSSNRITDVSALKTCSALQSLQCQVTDSNLTGFQDLLALKSLKSISTHREIMSKKDRDAFKRARPKVELELG